jgi:hypothetical protein
MISDMRIPYEILIRFDDSGTPKGAQVQYRQRLIVDGVVRADDILPAEPLSLDNFPDGQLISDATRDALIAVSSRDIQIARLGSELEATAAGLSALKASAALPSPDAETALSELFEPPAWTAPRKLSEPVESGT